MLRPYLNGRRGLLILDNAPAHVHAQVISSLADANCKALFLPPQTTQHLQPLDVGVNGPFKVRCKHYWSDWQVALNGQKPTTKESRIALCNRVSLAFSEIDPQTVRNAFSKCEF